tara:strand:+ start:718 stop:1149 length:432 start_codon:yes stop_codon:yes gene_type:complete
MIKKLIALIVLLPIFDIVIIFYISNYVTPYFIVLEIFITFALAIFIFNDLRSSNNLKLLNFFNSLKYINMIIFKLTSFFCLMLPGIITDIIGLLILNSFLQHKIKNYILYNILKINTFSDNGAFEGTFYHLDKEKNITYKKDE